MTTSLKVAVLLLIVLLVAVGGVLTFRVGPAPSLVLKPDAPGLGRRTPVRVEAAAAGRGLFRLRLEVVQGDRVQVVADKSYAPRAVWAFWGPRTERPTLSVASSQHYVAQGGAEVAVYRVGPTSVRDGVRVGDWFFPGYALPGGGPQDRFAFFAVPYDIPDGAKARLEAEDEVGNLIELPIVDRFFPKPFARERITLEEAFMSKVVPEIRAETPELSDRGSLLENFLAINREVRAQNAKVLGDLAGRSQPRFLWKETFLAMPNGKVMSAFADRRTYFYQGKEVDQQFHLGFDLASVEKAPVPAANSGVVALARYLGIYGNTVVVDHGYGLMSLYAHLSTASVTPGQEVARGETLGQTGATGLAGGDHLHFTMLLQGLPVNPNEWWDAHWIEDRLARKLGAALPFAPPPGEGGQKARSSGKKTGAAKKAAPPKKTRPKRR